MLKFSKENRNTLMDMGEPQFKNKDLPSIQDEEINKDVYITIEDEPYRFTVVSMGTPHAITFIENIDNIPLEKYGPIIENHASFPNKTNVEFVQIKDKEHIKMKVWQRSCDETSVYKAGACAGVVAGGVNGYTNENVNVELPDGELHIKWGQDNHIYVAETSE